MACSASGSKSPLPSSLFVVIGIGNSLVDVAGLTLVQRAVPDDVLARVFGVIQMLWLASIGIGAAVAPALDLVARRRETALIATGAFLPLLVVLLGTSVARIDADCAGAGGEELRILASRADLRAASRRRRSSTLPRASFRSASTPAR